MGVNARVVPRFEAHDYLSFFQHSGLLSRKFQCQ